MVYYDDSQKQCVAYCGQNANRKGDPFTTFQQAADHERGCGNCKRLKRKVNHIDLSLTDAVAGDESDGVFFAIAHEMGEL